LVKHGIYNLSGAGVRIGLAILVIPVLVRVMGIGQYGLWSLASAIVGLLALADGGLSISITVFLSKELARTDDASAARTLCVVLIMSLVLTTATATFLWIGASRVANLFSALSGSEHRVLTKALQIGALLVWSRILQSVLIGVEQAYRRYGSSNLLVSLQSVIGNLGMIPVVWAGGRVFALMAWQVVATAGISVAHAWLVWTLARPLLRQMKWDKDKAVRISRYSIVAWLSSLGAILFGYGDRLIVGGILGTAVLGAYAAITSVATQINAMSGAAVQPFLPSASGLVARNAEGNDALGANLRLAFRINAVVALGMGVVLFVLAHPVLRVILPGADNPTTLLALRLAIVIYSVYSINAVGYFALCSVEAVKSAMIIVLSSAVVSLLFIRWGARVAGLIGAILGNAAYFGTLLLNVSGTKALRVGYQWLRWIAFPVGWFLAGLALGIVGPNSLISRVLLLSCYSAILLVWFLMTNREMRGFLAPGN
jgi:O-antigen/teichoic acid export membrane protein